MLEIRQAIYLHNAFQPGIRRNAGNPPSFGNRFAFNLMHADYFVGGGMGSAEQKQYQAAIAWFQRALALNPHNKRASYYLARAYTMNQQPEKACKQYRQLVQYDPNFLQLNAHLGTCALRSQDIARAKVYFERQIAINNMDWHTYYQLALIENTLKSPDNAIDYLKEIESIHAVKKLDEGEYLKVQKALAQLYLNAANWEQAHQTLQHIHTLIPDEVWLEPLIDRVKASMNTSL